MKRPRLPNGASTSGNAEPNWTRDSMVGSMRWFRGEAKASMALPLGAPAHDSKHEYTWCGTAA